MIAEVPSGDVEIVNTTKIERIDELTEDIEQGKADVEKHDQEFEKTQGGAGDENNKDNENDEDGSSSCSCNVARMSWKGKVVFMVALGSMIMNGVAMAVKATIMVFVAGFIALFIAPVVMGQQLKLENTESFDDVHNKLRKDVNTLGEENDKLTAENDALEEQLGKLQEEEKRLKDITESQGVNVDEFVALVKENRLLLDKQEATVRNSAAQALSSILIYSDRDVDGTISEDELTKLEAKLRVLPGVQVNYRSLRKSVADSGGRIGELLKLANQIALDPDDPDAATDDEPVFSIKRDEEEDDEKKSDKK